jgi:hypothetical protein
MVDISTRKFFRTSLVNRQVMQKRTVKTSGCSTITDCLCGRHIPKNNIIQTPPNFSDWNLIHIVPLLRCVITPATFRISKNMPRHLWNGWMNLFGDLVDYRDEAVWDRKDHFVSLTKSVPHDRVSIKSDFFCSDSSVRPRKFNLKFLILFHGKAYTRLNWRSRR